MIAYKGFNADMTCTLGQGRYQYTIGETVCETSSKCARTGLHCAENPLDCLAYYPLGNNNRYCLVEAMGSLDEDDVDSRISCTKMRIVRELSLKQLCSAAMAYMLQHPKREWVKSGKLLEVKNMEAEGAGYGAIAIARGENPRVRGRRGTAVGILKEKDGFFLAAKVGIVGEDIQPDIWYQLNEEGMWEDEKKNSYVDTAIVTK
ncbi:DUF7666 domain-containing protein [Anaerobutyricum hallii]|uniref:DUF7666 domain-containing protein n=1 Tax=Anaerobutyricum hallii TaxID=39488 RepID=UPI000E7292FA|nr:hypothetical protein [Anaerobutyricum hallii]RJW41976.1 hypothetical protein DXC97_02630 [Lachnospiraceae bacterium TF09-5]